MIQHQEMSEIKMSLQHILLGFLREEAGSGYDLNKRLDAQAKHFWTTEQSQIYRALYRMHAAGWIVFETVIQDDSPNKKIYHLTTAGAAELERWLRQPTEEVLPSHIWLAKLYVGQNLEYADVAQIMQSRRATLVEYRGWVHLRRRLIEQQSAKNVETTLRLLTLEHSLRLLDAEINWLDNTLDKLGALLHV
jgi:PadR family transcriptional regulator, regulatory protein AphA